MKLLNQGCAILSLIVISIGLIYAFLLAVI